VLRAINALDHKKGRPLNTIKDVDGEVEWAKEIVFFALFSDLLIEQSEAPFSFPIKH
jgi:hypothetical protein